MRHYLGVDAGGTFTRFVLFDESGNQVERHVIDSIHFMKIGFDGIQDQLSQVKKYFESLNYNFDHIDVVIGMAGYGKDQTIRDNIEKAVWAIYPHAILMNDAQIAMISALDNQDGVYVISGTGSIAFRKLGCVEDRRGGFGYLLGDEGSAFWIGRQLLALFTKQADGRLPQGGFYREVMSHFELTSPYDLIGIANAQKDEYRNWVAQLSGLASKFTDEPEVYHVFKQAGLELAELANNFELEAPTNIAVGGGVLKHNEIVRNTFIENLKSDFILVDNKQPVEYTAYILCAK